MLRPQASGTSTRTTKQVPGDVSECEFMREVVMEESQAINLPHVAFGGANEVPMNHGFVETGSTDSLTNSIQGPCMDKCMGNGSILNYNIGSQAKEVVDLTQNHSPPMLIRSPLSECTNTVGNQPTPTSLESFKRLARVVSTKQQALPPECSSDRRPGLELDDGQGSKKQQRDGCEWYKQENFQVETGVQSHPSQ